MQQEDKNTGMAGYRTEGLSQLVKHKKTVLQVFLTSGGVGPDNDHFSLLLGAGWIAIIVFLCSWEQAG